MTRKKLPKVLTGLTGQENDEPVHPAQPEAAVLTRSVAATRSAPPPVAAPPISPDLEPSSAIDLGHARAAPERTRRLSFAVATVERHANLSALGGVIPVPLLNAASVTALIVRMVKALSAIYGVPFERERARAWSLGIMGGVMPSGLSMITSSTLSVVLPGSLLVGLAVSSVAASSMTRNIGRLLIDHFENGATDLPLLPPKAG